jgi:ribokinase
VHVAAVGHLEWIEFVRGDHVPVAGEIVHANDSFEEPAGGGAVAAVQLARLAGRATFLTALGDDELARRTRARLAELDVAVRDAARQSPTRRGLTFLDAQGERTIITIGERLAPRGRDELDWKDLAEADGVYLTATDADGLHAARAAGVLVATPRAGRVLHEAGVRLDALVYSDLDEFETSYARALDPAPSLLVATRGGRGGRYETAQGERGTWDAAPLPGPVADSYGAGDSFAAALTFALAQGRDPEAALQIAALAGATCLTGRGPYEHQLTADAL